MRAALGVAITLAWWAAVGAGLEWVWPRTGSPEPLTGATVGLLFGVMMLATQFAEHKGWIRGVFGEREDLKQKQEQLARDRDQIMQEARAKLN